MAIDENARCARMDSEHSVLEEAPVCKRLGEQSMTVALSLVRIAGQILQHLQELV
jgi:hypothetical protein